MNTTEANVKRTSFGDMWVLMGDTKEEVQTELNRMIMSGMKSTSKVVPMGRKWTATYQTPGQSAELCKITRIGKQYMISGPSEGAVLCELDRMVGMGAVLVSKPTPATGGNWVAICEDSGIFKFH